MSDKLCAPHGRSYLEWHTWALQMSKTHRQERCPICGLFHIWVPKEAIGPDSGDGEECRYCRGSHQGDVVGFHPGACDWCPEHSRSAHCDDSYHGDAVVSVGRRDNHHLCQSCAALPKFKRRTYRRALKVGDADAG